MATAGAQMGIYQLSDDVGGYRRCSNWFLPALCMMMKVAIVGAQIGIYQLSDDEGGYRGCSNGYLPAL